MSWLTTASLRSHSHIWSPLSLSLVSVCAYVWLMFWLTTAWCLEYLIVWRLVSVVVDTGVAYTLSPTMSHTHTYTHAHWYHQYSHMSCCTVCMICFNRHQYVFTVLIYVWYTIVSHCLTMHPHLLINCIYLLSMLTVYLGLFRVTVCLFSGNDPRSWSWKITQNLTRLFMSLGVFCCWWWWLLLRFFCCPPLLLFPRP